MTHHNQSKPAQQGSALIVSLIMLLLVTILALSMSRTTTLTERMAGNSRDMAAALQGSEAALREGENFLANADKGILNSSGNCTQITALCGATDANTWQEADLIAQTDAWWSSKGMEFGTAGKDMTELASDPHFVVERLANIKDTSLTSEASTIGYFEISARSHGKSDQTESVVQSVYAKPL